MGASGSKTKEDEALHLCRERKKFVRRALDCRCSLAAAHATYIQCLKSTGTALRKFVQPEDSLESSLYSSASATLEPHSLTEKSGSRLSFSSASASQHFDVVERLSPSPPTSSRFQVNHMSYRSRFTKNVEEKPSVTGTIASLRATQNCTSPLAQKESPWDYFGLSRSIGNRRPSHDQREMAHGFENDDDEGIPDQETEDDFDDSPSETLVRSFDNLNRGKGHVPPSASPTMLAARTVTPKNESLNEEKLNSPKLSPIRTKSAEAAAQTDAKMAPDFEDVTEHKVALKDFFRSMRDVECLFGKASDCGREFPRMLEANELHFRPIIHGREKGSTTSMLLKACFSRGEEPSQVPEDPGQSATKYLAWDRTTPSRSSSSRNPLVANSRDDGDDLSGDLFGISRMTSGSHASTLDRLYARECKLYDEVKASQTVRRQYDLKCKVLGEQESRAESSKKIDKTRAIVKDLHSRIRVSILRIHSISKSIEELRDNELQPQLEELIEGLSRMWESMFDCHRLQLHIITIANSNNSSTISVHSELHRHFTLVLENELSSLSTRFSKWIAAQKSYVQTIDSWLHKCVVALLQRPSTRRKSRRAVPLPLRDSGPSIYTVTGVWLETLKSLPVKKVVDTASGLAAGASRFLPPKEMKTTEGGPVLDGPGNDEHAFKDGNAGCDHFRTSLVIFVSELSSFAQNLVKM